MTHDAHGSPSAEDAAESVHRVRALAGDLVARPLDEPAADRLAEVLNELAGEDRAALRRLVSRRRGSVPRRGFTLLTDSGEDQNVPNTPSQGSGSRRPTREGVQSR